MYIKHFVLIYTCTVCTRTINAYHAKPPYMNKDIHAETFPTTKTLRKINRTVLGQRVSARASPSLPLSLSSLSLSSRKAFSSPLTCTEQTLPRPYMAYTV